MDPVAMYEVPGTGLIVGQKYPGHGPWQAQRKMAEMEAHTCKMLCREMYEFLSKRNQKIFKASLQMLGVWEVEEAANGRVQES